MNQKTPRQLFMHPVHFLSFGLGSGLAPKAPGTVGTLLALCIYLALAKLSATLYILILLLTILVGIGLCEATSRALGVEDHPAIVWDEFAGFWLTMLAAPAGYGWLFTGFVLFRLFDIWKPWPIRQIDHNVKGGFGIMLDDLLAGIYALVIMQLLQNLIL